MRWKVILVCLIALFSFIPVYYLRVQAQTPATVSVSLETPSPQLLTVNEPPSLSSICRGPSNWWWAVVVQVGLSGFYLWRRRSAPTGSAMRWLSSFSILAYFIYAATGCRCSASLICRSAVLINLGIFGLGVVATLLNAGYFRGLKLKR